MSTLRVHVHATAQAAQRALAVARAATRDDAVRVSRDNPLTRAIVRWLDAREAELRHRFIREHVELETERMDAALHVLGLGRGERRFRHAPAIAPVGGPGARAWSVWDDAEGRVVAILPTGFEAFDLATRLNYYWHWYVDLNQGA